MANQKTFNGYTNNSGWDYQIIVEETSQDQENNTTSIRIASQLGRLGSNSYMTNAYVTETFTVNGQKYSRTSYLYRGDSNHKVFYQNAWEYTRTGNSINGDYFPTSPVYYTYISGIKHNQDGKKTISIKASASLDVSAPTSANVNSVNYTLTPIPRNPLANFKVSNSWVFGKVFYKVNNIWVPAKKIFYKMNGVWLEDTLKG